MFEMYLFATVLFEIWKEKHNLTHTTSWCQISEFYKQHASKPCVSYNYVQVCMLYLFIFFFSLRTNKLSLWNFLSSVSRKPFWTLGIFCVLTVLLWFLQDVRLQGTCSSLLAPEPKGLSRPLSWEGCRLSAPAASLNMAHFSSRLSRLAIGIPRGFLYRVA